MSKGLASSVFGYHPQHPVRRAGSALGPPHARLAVQRGQHACARHPLGLLQLPGVPRRQGLPVRVPRGGALQHGHPQLCVDEQRKLRTVQAKPTR